MTIEKNLALDILQSFKFAVLRRVSPGIYEFFGRAPTYYDAFFPPTGDGHCTTPWDRSPMLEYFLGEAEEFFSLGEKGSICSGTWEEDGLTQTNTALKAIAADFGGVQAIIICLLEEDYSERISILRRARRQLLENKILSNNLSIFKEKSRIDGLTSIFNRTTFMDLLLDEIKRSQILDYPLALLILDIDDFKKVNDSYGHLIGDKILQNMGALLKSALRRSDIVARYGGEEFAVLIPHAPMSEAVQVAEKIRANLAAMIVPDAPGITTSIGCTAYKHDESSDTFFKRADEALYVAKRSGKNKVCVK